jgi:hypothetical protein
MVAAMTSTMRRRLIALAAAYAVALQAVLASFAVLSAAGAVPGLCASSAAETPGSDPGYAAPCVACPAYCGNGGLPGVPPACASVLARDAGADRIEHPMLRLGERSAPRNLPPSRAPPMA